MILDHLKYTTLLKHVILSINCKDAGDKVCNHTMYYETEEELYANAKELGLKNMDIQMRLGKKKFLAI